MEVAAGAATEEGMAAEMGLAAKLAVATAAAALAETVEDSHSMPDGRRARRRL